MLNMWGKKIRNNAKIILALFITIPKINFPKLYIQKKNSTKPSRIKRMRVKDM